MSDTTLLSLPTTTTDVYHSYDTEPVLDTELDYTCSGCGEVECECDWIYDS